MPESTATVERDTVTVMRKRRMEWDPLDVTAPNVNNVHGSIGGVIDSHQENTTSGGGGGIGPSDAKISHLANVKERRKTGASTNNGNILFLLMMITNKLLNL